MVPTTLPFSYWAWRQVVTQRKNRMAARSLGAEGSLISMT
jgi:hypothetical protein